MQGGKTFITCAVTGNLTRPEQTPHLPITPEHIANECLGAVAEGAAAVHIHVRDPNTGRPSMDVALYREVMERVRAKDPTVIINLTTGPGGRFVPSADDPKVYAAGTTLLPPLERVKHVIELRPDVCSLDLNTMNSGPDVVINTPANVRKMAQAMNAAGVLPELEVFDSGDIHLARDLLSDGTLKGPGLFTIVMGVKYGFASVPGTLFYEKQLLPAGAVWSAFGIGRAEYPMLAQAWLLGGNVRVGLEDNIYLSKGVLARSNAELVAKARRVVEDLGGAIATAAEARAMLGVPPQGRSPGA